MPTMTLADTAPRRSIRWDRGDRRSIAGMAAFVLLLNLLGWGLLVLVVAPQRYDVGTSGVFGIGLGVTAFLLGVHHAFDADHIAAIDNTTRKLVGERKRALSVGMWFSLGHSSVVFLLCLLIAAGISALAGQVADDASQLQQVTGLIGTLVSGVFLLLIGLSRWRCGASAGSSSAGPLRAPQLRRRTRSALP